MVNSSEYLEKMAVDYRQHKRDVGGLVVARGESCDGGRAVVLAKAEVVASKEEVCLEEVNNVYEVLWSLRSAFKGMVEIVLKIF